MSTPTSASTSVGRSSLIMASGTAVSRGLGLVRNLLLVAVVGATGPIADAFDIANKVPNILFAIIAGGMLNAVIVPQVMRAYRSPNAQEYLDKLLSLTGTALLVITAVFTLGASAMVGLYTSNDWTTAQVALAVSFAFWCIPQLFFYGLYTVLGQVLNARGQFGPFMWAPALNNIISIAGLGAFLVIFGGAPRGGALVESWTTGQVALLGAVTTFGVICQALILVVPLWRSGFRWHLRFGIRGVGLRSAGRVGLWTFAAVLLDQVAVLVSSRIATSAPMAACLDAYTRAQCDAGTDSLVVAGNGAYTQALMVYLLPHSLVTVSIATALFTGMSAAAAIGDLKTVRANVSRGLRVIAVFTVFATAFFLVMSQPVMKVLVPTLHSADVVVVGQVLAALGLGLVPLGAMALMKWVYFAFEDGRTVFLIQIPVTIVLVGGALAGMALLPGRWWVVGVAAAMSLSNFVGVALRIGGMIDRLEGLDLARIVRLHVQLVAAAVAAGLIGWGILSVWGFEPSDSWWAALGVTTLVGTTMVAVYVLALRLMRVDELQGLIRPMLRKLPRFSR
ncbi:putative peptidoglycan lipid II flippase [Sanguibacter gelidistatuariae]|uniref:Putative peptidoglycan lipid II flippase n=1 Tax=Sanguibacter gelidistatuariae TaxID=1814289 RepID=A0A1G6H3Z1_9MICO|nr:lipid II flippase MurJ [Sanguibacter gelidistatuariae]SDB88972.1 putative peptidoglycan lipid II flippase [Sanguibacter gelidistatuariae]